MNSIRRPRRRPRVESVSFRTLWWVLVREAVHRMQCDCSFSPDRVCPTRLHLTRQWTWKVRLVGARMAGAQLRWRFPDE